jgi:hypothetical protein
MMARKGMPSWLAATVIVVMLTVLIGGAVEDLMRGELMYPNVYGLQVFAPYAIVVGMLMIVVVAVEVWRSR